MQSVLLVDRCDEFRESTESVSSRAVARSWSTCPPADDTSCGAAPHQIQATQSPGRGGTHVQYFGVGEVRWFGGCQVSDPVPYFGSVFLGLG